MTTPLRVSRPDDLGPALREARLDDGLTQSGLAEMAGVGRQWLNAFETGEKPSAPLDMVMRVVAALDVAVTLVRPAPPAAAGPHEAPVDLDVLLSEYDQ
jgi:transcriptional regulator with XRE-family HTH domain